MLPCRTEVQTFLAKYGSAAHLALLAVAPLFLFAFCDEYTIAIVILWLSLLEFCWLFFMPSVRRGEFLYNAINRVRRGVVFDPLFWILLVIVILCGLRAINGGISLVYDAENTIWKISPAGLPFLPGSVGTAGFLPFAAVVAIFLITQAIRHSLGRSARLMFVVIATILSGISSMVFIISFGRGHCRAAIDCSVGSLPTAALAFSVFLLISMVALLITFEREWYLASVLSIASIGGNFVATFLLSPAYLFLATCVGFGLMFVYVFVYAFLKLNGRVAFRILAVSFISFALGVAIAYLFLPKGLFEERLSAIDGVWFTEKYLNVRAALSSISFKAWVDHMWIGAGMGSFPMVFRFGADESIWAILPRGAQVAANGWWQVLVERGIVGGVMILMVACVLIYTYVRKAMVGIAVERYPHPLCSLAVFVFALAVFASFFDCSFLRCEGLMSVAAVLSVSAAAFPRKR